MSGVADKCNTSLGADPCRQGVAVDEFPIDEVVCRRRFDDFLYDWVPSFDDFEAVFDLAGGRPGFFNICVVLVDIRFCLTVYLLCSRENTLCVHTQLKSLPPLSEAAKKCTSGPIQAQCVSPFFHK